MTLDVDFSAKARNLNRQRNGSCARILCISFRWPSIGLCAFPGSCFERKKHHLMVDLPTLSVATLTAAPESPAAARSLVRRVQACVSAWMKERTDERSSWLVSLVLHLGIVVLLFLCPIALSGGNHADTTAGTLTRLEPGGDSGQLEGMVFLQGRGASDDGADEIAGLDDSRELLRAPWNGLDLMPAGTSADS